MKVLVTGVSSGIGKFLDLKFRGYGLTRENSKEVLKQLANVGVDTIIHCAFGSQRQSGVPGLARCYSDSLALTDELLKIPHHKFIYFSSVDVYTKNQKIHSEDEEITLEEPNGLYATLKILSEAIIAEKSKNHLILRPSSLLGRYARRNNLMRLIQDTEPKLSLTANSNLDFVGYDDVYRFVELGMSKDLQGIYNLVSSSKATIEEIASFLKKSRVQFGDFNYEVGNVSNRKLIEISNEFDKSSLDVVSEFLNSSAGSNPTKMV